VHRLTKKQARRIAVRAQMLDARRPTDLLAVVQRLTLFQINPTAAIAPSADLVAWSRLGSTYLPDQLKQAVEADRTLFELDAMVRPMGDLGLYLAGASDFPDYDRSRAWFRDNDRFRRDILKLLRKSGPLTSRDIPHTCVVPWASSGWTHDRNVTQMLEFLMMRGEIAIAGRVGRERMWDLGERVYAADVEVPSVELLRAPDPARRPAGREGRRQGRPQGVDAARERDPRGREVHARNDEGRAGRARGPRLVARAGLGSFVDSRDERHQVEQAPGFLRMVLGVAVASVLLDRGVELGPELLRLVGRQP
jgi:hypothetical protein